MALKDEPARQVLANYPHHFTNRVLFADMDGFRHLNNVAIARFFEEGRAALMMEAFGLKMLPDAAGPTILVASFAVDYLAQAYYPGMVEVGSAILRVGTSSVQMAHAAWQAGKCFALAHGVLVKTVADRAAPLTETEKAQLARFAFAGGQPASP
jgi:acyl-CoA thioester hydrolase